MSAPTLKQVLACLDTLAAAYAQELTGSPRNPQDFHRAVDELAAMRQSIERHFSLSRELVSRPISRHRSRSFVQVG